MNLFDTVARTPAESTGAPQVPREQLLERLAKTRTEIKRRQYFADPNLWVRERLREDIWVAQQQILSALAKHRKVAVASCHDVGKSFIASRAVGWWLDRDKTGDAFVVTTAPTAHQVKAILWREIGRVHSAGKLRGRVTQTEWKMPTRDGREELVAYGRKPDDYDPTSFQGIHAPRVLVVMDEACGIPVMLYEAADSLTTNDESKQLLIGNPDDPQTEFAEKCKPGSGWYVIEISAFDSPNFTGEHLPKRVLGQLIGRTYVEEKRKKWAPRWFWVNAENVPCEPHEGVKCVAPLGAKLEETNPYWQSKILGKFPEIGTAGGLIPLSWIRAAQQRSLEAKLGDPNQLGVDVGAGGDESCIVHRHGPVFRVVLEDRNPDTMETCGNVVAMLETTGADLANIDEIGIGKGVANRGQELKRLNEITATFVGVNVGKAAYDDQHYVNLRAELYWNLRELFEQNLIDLDPDDDDTAAQLVELRYKRMSNGKIQIESKDDAKKRGVASPNRAEALMLAATRLPEEEEWVIN